MAQQAKCSHIVEIALAAAFRHRNNMVGVPKGFPAPFRDLPFFEKTAAGRVIEFAKVAAQRERIRTADRTYTLVTCQNLIAEITGIGSQLPLVDTGISAESAAALRDFLVAPAA